MSLSAILILFCKWPRPGYSKSRLAHDIGEEPACRVARALLDCALEDLLAWPGPAWLAASDAAECEPFAALLARRGPGREPAIEIHAQGSGNLGERLAAMDTKARRAGYRKRLFIGSDAPLMSADLLRRAAAGLGTCDMLLADSTDGGVTLMGCAADWPPLAALPWSTNRLAGALAAAGEAAGLKVARMGGGFDVDGISDLAPASRALVGDIRPARQALKTLVDTLL